MRRATTMGLFIMLLLTFSSCAFLQRIDIQQQELTIKTVARTGMILGLEELVQDDRTRVIIAKHLRMDIAENVLSLLSDEQAQISTTNLNMLLAKIPIALRPFVGDALGILNVYIEQTNTESQLDENAVRLLKAFFNSIVEGCDFVITKAGEADDGMGSCGFSCPKESPQGREATVH